MTEHAYRRTGYDAKGCKSIQLALDSFNMNWGVTVKEGHFYGSTVQGPILMQAKGFNYIVRVDNNRVLGTCKDQFKPIQNREALGVFQPMVDEGILKLDSFGCLDWGRKVWMLAEFAGSECVITGEDFVRQFLLVITANDGQTCVSAGIIPTRMWCTNQMAGLSKFLTRIRHTDLAVLRLEELKLDILDQYEEAQLFTRSLQHLAQYQIAPKDASDYFKDVFNINEEVLTVSHQQKLETLMHLYEAGQGQQLQGVGGTLYAAYNAVTEYLNYVAGKKDESRLKSLWTGANSNILEYAYHAAMELAA